MDGTIPSMLTLDVTFSVFCVFCSFPDDALVLEACLRFEGPMVLIPSSLSVAIFFFHRTAVEPQRGNYPIEWELSFFDHTSSSSHSILEMTKTILHQVRWLCHCIRAVTVALQFWILFLLCEMTQVFWKHWRTSKDGRDVVMPSFSLHTAYQSVFLIFSPGSPVEIDESSALMLCCSDLHLFLVSLRLRHLGRNSKPFRR